MKNILIILLLSTLLSSCSSDIKEEKTIKIKASDLREMVVNVEGMTCVGCEVTLEKAIKKAGGVVTVKASAGENKAVVKYDKSKTDIKKIVKTIQDAGYKASEKTK